MRGMEKAAKHAPWVAIVLALIGPFFGYLEVRAVHRSAGRGADEAKGATGAAYRLLVREVDRLGEDIDACHERVDRLGEALEEISIATPLEVAEQRQILRPAPTRLPMAAEELPAGSLKEALQADDEFK